MNAEETYEPWQEHAFEVGYVLGMLVSVLSMPVGIWVTFHVLSADGSLLSVSAFFSLHLIAIPTVVGFVTVFIVKCSERKFHRESHFDQTTWQGSAVQSQDFHWRRHGPVVYGKHKSFRIEVRNISSPSPSNVLWKVTHRDRLIESGYAANPGIAAQCALRVVNRRSVEDNELDALVKSLSGGHPIRANPNEEEPKMSRGPEVLRRYLSHQT